MAIYNMNFSQLNRTKVKNKAYIIPKEQIREFMKPDGPDYKKLCKNAVDSLTNQTLKKR